MKKHSDVNEKSKSKSLHNSTSEEIPEGSASLLPPAFNLSSNGAQVQVAQLKSSKHQLSKVPHVKLPPGLNKTLLAINAGNQFFTLGKELWDTIKGLKEPEGFLNAVGKYFDITGDNIDKSFEKYKKRNENLDPSYNNSHEDLTDEQMQGSGRKRFGNAVDGAKEIGLKASFKGLQVLAKMKKLTLTDAFFWGLEKVVAKGYQDEVKDIKKIAGWDKAKDFGQQILADQIASHLLSEYSKSGEISRALKQAGYGDKSAREKALSHCNADLKESIKMILRNQAGVALDNAKFWSDMASIKTPSQGKKYLMNAHSYLHVNQNKGLKTNDLIFKSRFVKHFSLAYSKFKNGK